jgi:hypothetical protein
MSKVTIGSFSKNIIATQSNLSNQEVLDLVLKEFPNAKTSLSCIAWYKSDMKKHNYKVSKFQERTIEVIELELIAANDKVQMLQDELESLKSSQEESELLMLATLAAKYKKEVV